MRYYHVSLKDLGSKVTLTAKVPYGRNPDECSETKRVCFAPTIWQCMAGRIGSDGVSCQVGEYVFHTPKAERTRGRINNPAVYYTDKKLFKPKEVADFKKTGERWHKGDIEVHRIGFVDIKTLMTTGRIEITNRRQSVVSRELYAGWCHGVERCAIVGWYERPPFEPLTAPRRT